MTGRAGILLASCAVTIFAAVNVAAATLGPAAARPLLLLFTVAAVGVAAQTAALEFAALRWALLFSMPPVIALVAEGSPTWLIGPLATLLFVASELCALSWEIRGAGSSAPIPWDRLRIVGQLGALGLVASLAVEGIASGPVLGGTLAVVLGGIALVGLALAVFGRAR